jgi:hypothetical protein
MDIVEKEVNMNKGIVSHILPRYNDKIKELSMGDGEEIRSSSSPPPPNSKRVPIKGRERPKTITRQKNVLKNI